MTKLRRFLVEAISFTACLFIGAAVFQAIEYKDPMNSKTNSSEILKAIAKNIRQKYNISAQEMNHTIQQLRSEVAKDQREDRDHWDFSGCYFFAGTVAFTIGFGHQTPQTSLGQLMVIIYAMIAIPITGLMLSACGERLAEQQQKTVLFIEKKIFGREATHLQGKTIAMNVFVLLLFFIFGSIMTKYYYDGWSIVEGIYFLWICMTAVGFGDYIINNGKPYYEGDTVKTIMLRFNVIFLIIGLCQVSCILVSIQNALETKFVEKVGNDEDSNAENEHKDEEELGTANEACELEMVENSERKNCETS